MDFKEFYNLTPGQRTARRRRTVARPFDAEWRNEQLIVICDAIASNPFIKAELGDNVDISVNASKDGLAYVFAVSRHVSGGVSGS